MRRYGILLLPLVIVVVLGFVGVTTAASGGDAADDGPAPEGSVDIADFAFGPADVTVAAGTAVTWTNRDGSPHSIQDDTGDDLFPESDELDQGDTFSFTYADPGTYAYICGIHNYMRGTVTVTG
jgi:plastocyanin